MKYRGDLVRLARQARRLTQTELARASGFSQSFVSMFEDGLREISEEQIHTLATALNFPVDFFVHSDPVLGAGVGDVFHRKRKSMSSKDLEAVHAWRNIGTTSLRRLLGPVEWPETILEGWRGDVDDASIEKAAQLLRARLMLPHGPVGNVSDALERAGVWIIPLRFHTPQIDAIGQWTAGLPPLIFVNPEITQDRLRFTLMREIGHLVLHNHATFPKLHEEIEQQANRFAGAFLMPREDIQKDLRDLRLARLAALKPRWKVAMSALIVRAYQLKTITGQTQQSLFRELGRHGWRTREPESLDIRGEDPFRRYRELLNLYRERLSYSTTQIAAVSLVSTEDLSAVSAGTSTSHLRVVG